MHAHRPEVWSIMLCLAVGCGPAVTEPTASGTSSSSGAPVEPGSSTSGSLSSTSTGAAEPGPSSGSSSSGRDGTSSTTAVVIPTDCDPYVQDCPEGYKCNPYSNDGSIALDAVRCVPIDPKATAIGTPCTRRGYGGSNGSDTCERGAVCWSPIPSDPEGMCFELCGGSSGMPACGAETSTCLFGYEDVWGICAEDCDPTQTGCLAGWTCTGSSNGFQCFPQVEGRAQGDTCSIGPQCALGLACVPPVRGLCDLDGFGCCLPYCDLNAPDCPDGLTCAPYDAQALPPEYAHVGICSAL